MKKIIIFPFITIIFSGCAYYQPIGISSTSVGSQYERPSGIAEGVSRRWLIFPCYNACPIGEDSLKSAIDNALEGQVGDTLANVYAERRIIAFPHIYLPLIVRSDVIVTGTLVKYNTKEFPPDNAEYLYSNSPAKIWEGLLSLEREDQLRRIKTLSEDSRTKLADYANYMEFSIKDGSREEILFLTILNRKPKKPTKAPVSPSSWDEIECNMYYCMTLLSAETQARKITQLQKSAEYSDQAKLRNIAKAAKKRIRTCSNGTIFVAPEIKLESGERSFLEYLCKIGELNK
ncbi:MAG: hypothetical protein COX65_06535 [Elusimicrobia bacterium CG_4_10_14_0_2_um_filter_56_8]|nr:MAG: hypothetical protein AUJ51_03870 [Elusimicrobia bacterium CG1_02_56_21]PJA13821.1 MAG: hypothetical protein COX65_06535 [Elusimicrobia bacterium CG_4_10_14_0_2_um_filter_56_8]